MFNEVTEPVRLMNIFAKLENIIDSFAQSFYTLEHIMNKLKLNLLLKQKISCPLLPAIKTHCIDVFKSHIRMRNDTLILDLSLLNLDLLSDCQQNDQ